tara:strand:- start:1532 stop:2338 length:807 start_codon:yes stop_codon:yes gene_type:complete
MIKLFLARAVLALMAAIVLVPLVWTVLNAFKENVDLLTSTPQIFFTPVLDNVAYVLGRESVFHALANSVIVCLTAVIIGTVVGLPAAYAVARHPNRWTGEFQFFVLSLRFLPPVAVAIPLMVIWLRLDIYDTKLGLILIYSFLTISVTVWLAIPAFQQVPRSIEEAARVDGYGPYAVFVRVALPVAAKGLVGALAFSFVLVWNEFLLALMLTTSDAKTLPMVASELSQLGKSVPWGILNAAVVLLSLPPLLLLGALNGFLNRMITRKA